MGKRDRKAPSSDPNHPSYKVICISMYNDDLANMDEIVAKLKARGLTGVSRSLLIRYALSKIDLDVAFRTIPRR